MNFLEWMGLSKLMKDTEPDNVIKFPEKIPEMPKVVPPIPEPEKPTKIFYKIGLTDNNRVSLMLTSGEILMTKLGGQNLIEQLEVFINQLSDENDAA